MDACTIIAKNYTAQARVLARSYLDHHPDGRFTVLVVDDHEQYLDPAQEPFRLVTPAEIDCEPFDDMAARYDVVELSTAVKPWLLRRLLAEGAEAITYLDPDIRVYSDLRHLDELARQRGLVLTPHNTRPIPDDGHRPTQVDILIAGVYNLGYVSLGAHEQTGALLDWWSDRLRRDCRWDPQYGYFVDQRWFDLAPGLVSDYAIVRESTYNVAYWNVHARDVRFTGERYEVDGMPLRFFHFSGFDPSEPHLLSRHQTRVKLSRRPDLLRICREYAEAVAAEGHDECRRWPYTYATLPDGSVFTSLLRKLYAFAADAGEVTESPFGEAGCEEFLDWLDQTPDDAPVGVNRAVAELYGTRADIRARFPDLSGDGVRDLLRWLRTTEDAGAQLPAQLTARDAKLPTRRRAAGHRAGYEGDLQEDDVRASLPEAAQGRTQASDLGVNVVGYFRSELGVGEAARQIVSALDAASVPLLPLHGRTIPPNRQGHHFAYLDHRAAEFPINLICMNADALPEFAAQAGPGFFSDRYSIGLWFWEISHFPDRWQRSFELLDEVWAPSQHVADALAAVAPIPTVRMTLPVVVPPHRPMSRAELRLPEDFLFLFTFDYHSVFARKNPLAVVEAYTRAFSPSDGASLVVKCINESSDMANHERLLLAAAGRPDVHIVAGYLAPEANSALAGACDCYVSLHRSEGFGLTMAEAMYAGKPVIATAYSGNLDFMTADNSLLVDYRLVSIGRGADPYPADAEWADPDVGQAAGLMRRVFDSPQSAAAVGARAAVDIRRTHSAAVAGAAMARRLERVLLSRCRPRTQQLPPPAALVGLPEQVAKGLAGQRRAGAGGFLRRVVLRAMRPVTNHQGRVDARIVRTLEEQLDQDRLLQSATAQLRSEVTRSEAEIMRAVRALEVAGRGQPAAFRAALAEQQEAVLARLDAMQRAVDAAGALRDPVLARLDAMQRAVDAGAALRDPVLARLDAMQRAVDAGAALRDPVLARLDAMQRAVDAAGALHDPVVARLDEIDHRLQQVTGEMHALPYTAGRPFSNMQHPLAGAVQGYRGASPDGAPDDDMYRHFEDVFRGSERFVRERQRAFLPLLGARTPVLDFGCGRGEFLDLLREQGIEYLGVDIDAGMVTRCHEKGHAAVVCADGLEYLDSLEDGELGVIFSAQVIEHLAVDDLLRFMTVARAKLAPSGILIAETVNPHSVPALKTFWVDPTHKRPVFPEVVLALSRQIGFPAAFVFHPYGTGEIEVDRYAEGEYAIVAGGESLLGDGEAPSGVASLTVR